MDEPTDHRANSGPAQEPASANPLGGVGQLFVFLAEGARALFEFWLPRKYAAPEPVVEEEAPEKEPPADRAADVIENLARKLAPYPGQEG